MVKTAGSARSWGLLGGLTATALVWPLACDRNTGDSSPAAEAQASALAQVGQGVVVPALEDMQSDADALVEALEALSDAPSDPAALQAAQATFSTAYFTWQRLELMQIGPAGSSLSAIAGQDLRDEVYSWPTVNACRVDQETVAGGWSNASWFTDNLVNTYGLDAMEYLLWAGPDNDCPAQVAINDDGSWAALGDDGVAAARADYALALGLHIADQVDALHDAWSQDGGDFGGHLARATDDTPYGSDTEALNAVFDALFYLEKTTKDRKLATPLGIKECEAEDCATTVEGYWSGLGGQAIAANIEAFRDLFTGADGAGMDDLLVELGEQELVDQVLAHLDDALALADSIEAPLDELVREDPETVQALHDAVKRVADELKGDIATVLTLQIPAEAAGDND